MSKVETTLEQIVTYISSGIVAKTGDARVDYYAAEAVSEAAKDLRNVRLGRILSDETFKADIPALIAKLNSLVESIRFLPGAAAQTAKLQGFISDLRSVAGERGAKMAAG